MASTEELDSSELGTKQYWDDFYEVELNNYRDHEETGEIWFGMESVRRIVTWVMKEISDKGSSILDVGCGNGMTLLKMADAGYTNLTGVDYSQPAVDLAKSLVKDVPIQYQVADILDAKSADIFTSKFDMIIDKGTYDAISLTPDSSSRCRSLYIDSIHSLLHPSGHFIITSCNWTSAELQSHFNTKFTLKEEIPVKQFKFGGKVGQTVTCLVFIPL